MKIIGGFFYNYRGNGYGPFNTIGEAMTNFTEKFKIALGSYANIRPCFYLGTIKVDDNKRIIDEDMVRILDPYNDRISDMKVKAFVRTNIVTSKIEEILEIPDEDLEEFDEADREEYIIEIVDQWKDNYMDWGWEEIE